MGALPCASPSAPFVPTSRGVPTRVDFLQITLDRVEVHRRRAHLRVCNNAENVEVFLRIRNGNNAINDLKIKSPDSLFK